MATLDSRVDDYIANSSSFAQPILVHLRRIVHKACPDVEESIKWRSPHFLHHGLLASMAAFKEHCSFGFWKASLILQADPKAREAMGQFGRITRIADLPSARVLATYVRQAIALNEAGVKAVRNKTTSTRSTEPPSDLLAMLKRRGSALDNFRSLRASHQREYIEWIVEAKTDPTRQRRLATAVEWISEGKSRNWKYEKC